jgi:hypothetical protein
MLRFNLGSVLQEQYMKQCDFFLWYDKNEGNPRDKKIIEKLMGIIELMKKNEDRMIKLCVMGWSMAAMFVVVSVVLLIKM